MGFPTKNIKNEVFLSQGTPRSWRVDAVSPAESRREKIEEEVDFGTMNIVLYYMQEIERFRSSKAVFFVQSLLGLCWHPDAFVRRSRGLRPGREGGTGRGGGGWDEAQWVRREIMGSLTGLASGK